MYEFKALPELLRAAGVAGVVFLLETLLIFELDAVEDWKTWASAVGVALLQAMGAAVLSRMRKSGA